MFYKAIEEKTLKCETRRKFIVLKILDCDKYLTDEQVEQLRDICKSIEIGRSFDNKNLENEYLVINTDESYSEDIINILKKNGHWN